MMLPTEWRASDSLQLASDAAASLRYAAILGFSWFYGAWPDGWRCLNITWLEFYPIVAALTVWAERLKIHGFCF